MFAASLKTLGRLPDTLLRTNLLIVQHIREDTYRALQAMVQVGMHIKLVVGISYSVQHRWVEAIRSLGLRLEVPPFEDIPRLLHDEATALRERTTKTILLDVGGYGASLARDHQLAPWLIGVVEETKQGLWRYEEMPISVPVVHIADCRNKTIENVYVGRAIRDAVCSLAKSLGMSLERTEIGLLGYGQIGENVAFWLSENGIRPSIFDIDGFRMMIAMSRGFNTISKSALLSRSSLIIGCSGHDVIQSSEIGLLRDGAVLASGSSKRMEFGSVISSLNWKPSLSHEFAKVSTSRGLVLLCEGEPINFRFESLPLKIGDFLFANVLAALGHLVSSLPAAGVYTIPLEVQDQVLADWHSSYSS